MKRLLLLILLGLAACDVGDPGYVEVEGSGEFAVVGGKAVLTIIPDTVHDTTEVIVEVPIPCPECPPQCPEGWTCTPPPEPLGPTIQIDPVQGAWGTPDTVEAGTYYIRLDSEEWADLGISYDGGRVPGVANVTFFYDGVRSNVESLYPYEVNSPRAKPLTAGTLEIEARVTGDSAYSVFHTVVIVNPTEPPTPPDTVPPTPPDVTDARFGFLVDGVRWLGETLRNDTLIAGTYSMFIEPRNGGDWTGVDSVTVGFPAKEFASTTFPVPADNDDGSVVLEPGLNYMLAYEAWVADSMIEGRLATIIVPDTAQVYIDLDAPANLRIEQDSVFGYGTVPVVVWDESPQDRQGTNATGLPANDPNIQGDEIYPILFVSHVDTGEMIGLSCNPGGECVYDPEPFQNLHSWGIPIPTPDTIRACVRFEAWDCPDCIGTGGQIAGYTNSAGNWVPGIPISETTCKVLVVRG